MLRFLEKDTDSTFIFIYPTKVLRNNLSAVEDMNTPVRHWPKTNASRSKTFFPAVPGWILSKSPPMMATHRRKIVVSALVAS